MNPGSSRQARVRLVLLAFLLYAGLLLSPTSSAAQGKTEGGTRDNELTVQAGTFEDIARLLSNDLKKKHVKRVLIADFVAVNGRANLAWVTHRVEMNHIEDSWDGDFLRAIGGPTLFGSWLVDRLSDAPGWEGVDVLDRKKLATELSGLRSPGTNRFDPERVKSLSLSQDAALVTGTFTSADNGIGVTVAGVFWERGGRGVWTTLRAKIELTDEIKSHLQGPLESLAPSDGIYSAGQGGVGMCICDNQNHYFQDPTDSYTFDVFYTVVVNVDGHFSDISPCSGSKYFCQDALNAPDRFKWNCKPALNIDGKPVPTRLIIGLVYGGQP